MARIVVIGAGMGGLAVAARLAALGHEVTLCEQAATYGGQVGRYSRDGFTFDTGPSLLTLPAVYRDLFRKTGRPLEKVLDLVEADPACRYRCADGTWVELPNASRARTKRALDAALGAGAGDEWLRLLDRAAAIWDVIRKPYVESPLSDPRVLFRGPGALRALRAVAPWRSLRQLSRSYLRDTRLRDLLDRYALHLGSDPRRAPAALAVLPYVEQTFGTWYVPGGLRRLADSLYERCLERGVKVRFGTRVAEITTAGGRVDGVRLADGERVPAEVVVADADASVVYRELVRAPYREPRLRRAEPALSRFVVLLALRGRTPGLAHRTVLAGSGQDAEPDALFGRSPRPAPDPTVEVYAPGDPALRPDPDHEAWTVLVTVPRHGPAGTAGTVDWAAPGVADAYADRVLTVLAERGLDVRGRVLWRVVRTPVDLERETGSPGGAVCGTALHGWRGMFRRPANQSPVPGLYLVGRSTHPGGTLPMAGMSAALVAELIGRAG